MSKLVTSDNLKAYHAELAEHIKLLQRNTAYVLDDIVNYDGKTLKCTTAGTTATTKPDVSALDVGDTLPDGTAVWTRVDLDKRGIDYWASSTDYALNDQVVYNDKIYKCSTAHTSTSTFDATKWTEISAGSGGGISTYTTGTSYSTGDVVIKDQALYQANTNTSTTWVDSEWNIVGTTFNTTSTYAQKIVTNIVAPYEMLLQVGDSNYCKPPIDVLKKTGGSDNVTLTLENYNNSSAYTGTSDFLKIANSKVKLYNYKEYPITTQTLSTIDIGVSDEIDFDEFVSIKNMPNSSVLCMPFDNNLNDLCGNTFTYVGNPVISSAQSVFGTNSLYLDGNSRLYFAVDSSKITFGTNDFTFAWWEYRTASGNGHPIITYSSVEGNIYNGVLTGWVQGNMVSFVSVGTGNWNVFPGEMGSMGEASYNTWTHYALTREGNTFRTFKNGNLITTSIASGALHEVSPRYISIGYGASSYYQGYINNLLVVNGEALYTEDFTPPTQPYTRPNYNISSLEVN